MRFEFATADKIIYGLGSLAEVGRHAAALGLRALVVTGSDPRRAQGLLTLIEQAGLSHVNFPVSAEPTVALAREGIERARSQACDLVIGFGGGSALDTGKAISGLMTNGNDPLNFLEIIGRGKPLVHRAAPFIAIPTTAGTGTEVTRNAVLASKEHRVKVSMRSPLLLPRLAIVDPQLTLSVPPAVTASTGLDALTQVLEPYLSDRANPLVDGLCRDGLMRAGRALQQAFQNGENLTAREDMSLVSLYGGLALANAGLGAVHGFAGPFGGMFDASHGTICAAFLPATMKVNWEALQDRGGDHPSLGRFEDAARWLTGNPDASAEDLIAWLEELNRDLAIPRLRELGLTEDQFPALIEKAARSSSMKANPVQLTDAEMARILQLAL